MPVTKPVLAASKLGVLSWTPEASPGGETITVARQVEGEGAPTNLATGVDDLLGTWTDPNYTSALGNPGDTVTYTITRTDGVTPIASDPVVLTLPATQTISGPAAGHVTWPVDAAVDHAKVDIERRVNAGAWVTVASVDEWRGEWKDPEPHAPGAVYDYRVTRRELRTIPSAVSNTVQQTGAFKAPMVSAIGRNDDGTVSMALDYDGTPSQIDVQWSETVDFAVVLGSMQDQLTTNDAVPEDVWFRARLDGGPWSVPAQPARDDLVPVGAQIPVGSTQVVFLNGVKRRVGPFVALSTADGGLPSFVSLEAATGVTTGFWWVHHGKKRRVDPIA